VAGGGGGCNLISLCPLGVRLTLKQGPFCFTLRKRTERKNRKSGGGGKPTHKNNSWERDWCSDVANTKGRKTRENSKSAGEKGNDEVGRGDRIARNQHTPGGGVLFCKKKRWGRGGGGGCAGEGTTKKKKKKKKKITLMGGGGSASVSSKTKGDGGRRNNSLGGRKKL